MFAFKILVALMVLAMSLFFFSGLFNKDTRCKREDDLGTILFTIFFYGGFGLYCFIKFVRFIDKAFSLNIL